MLGGWIRIVVYLSLFFNPRALGSVQNFKVGFVMYPNFLAIEFFVALFNYVWFYVIDCPSFSKFWADYRSSSQWISKVFVVTCLYYWSSLMITWYQIVKYPWMIVNCGSNCQIVHEFLPFFQGILCCPLHPRPRWPHRPGGCVAPEAAIGASDRWQPETATARPGVAKAAFVAIAIVIVYDSTSTYGGFQTLGSPQIIHSNRVFHEIFFPWFSGIFWWFLVGGLVAMNFMFPYILGC